MTIDAHKVLVHKGNKFVMWNDYISSVSFGTIVLEYEALLFSFPVSCARFSDERGMVPVFGLALSPFSEWHSELLLQVQLRLSNIGPVWCHS
jgi:hypothetical protein